jgi:2,5-diketo-D-gluconate reductase B
MIATAYCSMAVGRVFSNLSLKAIAARHPKSIAQIVLRWLVRQNGVVALSRTVNETRVMENASIFDFELHQDEMTAIHALARPNSRVVNPLGLAHVWDAK